MKHRLSILITIALSLAGSACTSVFYQPDRYMYFPPELNGLHQENIYFKSSDGIRLHAWFFRAEKPKGTIIQFHGNAENLSSHYGSLAWIVAEGYNLFTFDYRGYGESLGSPDPEGVYRDGVTALDKAYELHESTKARSFIVYGQSLGGAVALRCFDDFSKRASTSLVVMDSTFTSYKDVAQQMLAKSWLTWIFSPLGQVLVSDEYSSEESAKKLSNRLLVIHDKGDPIVNFKNGKHLFDLAPGPKEFWELDRGRHVGVFLLESSENREKFLKLLSTL